MDSKTPVHALGINPIPTASGPVDCPCHSTVTHVRGPRWVRFPSILIQSHWTPTSLNQPSLWVSASWSWPIALIIPPPSLLLDTGSSATFASGSQLYNLDLPGDLAIALAVLNLVKYSCLCLPRAMITSVDFNFKEFTNSFGKFSH